eukprot:gene8731-679_t
MSFLFKNKPRCFEKEIEELVQTEKKQYPDQFDDIPLILCLSIDILEKQDYKEGIFRISGNQNVIKKLVTKCDSISLKPSSFKKELEKEIQASEGQYAIASLMKKYLLKLPDPIVNYELYPKFLEVNEIEDDKEKLIKLKECVYDLSNVRRKTMKKLMKLLYKIHLDVENTKMSAGNLAKAVGGSIIRNQEMNSITNLGAMRNSQDCVEQIILNYGYIFEGEKLKIDDETVEGEEEQQEKVPMEEVVSQQEELAYEQEEEEKCVQEEVSVQEEEVTYEQPEEEVYQEDEEAPVKEETTEQNYQEQVEKEEITDPVMEAQIPLKQAINRQIKLVSNEIDEEILSKKRRQRIRTFGVLALKQEIEKYDIDHEYDEYEQTYQDEQEEIGYEEPQQEEEISEYEYYLGEFQNQGKPQTEEEYYQQKAEEQQEFEYSQQDVGDVYDEGEYYTQEEYHQEDGQSHYPEEAEYPQQEYYEDEYYLKQYENPQDEEVNEEEDQQAELTQETTEQIQYDNVSEEHVQEEQYEFQRESFDAKSEYYEYQSHQHQEEEEEERDFSDIEQYHNSGQEQLTLSLQEQMKQQIVKQQEKKENKRNTIFGLTTEEFDENHFN